MKFSWNFKFAMATIVLVTFIISGIIIYTDQLIGFSKLEDQIDIYRIAGIRQARILNRKIDDVKEKIGDKSNVTSTVSATTTSETDPATMP